jgi:hypothetical protein
MSALATSAQPIGGLRIRPTLVAGRIADKDATRTLNAMHSLIHKNAGYAGADTSGRDTACE